MEEKVQKLLRDPAFDPFLRASVGKDSTGQDVTVLSMLARLGADPWREAEYLAGMTRKAAQARLDIWLARFGDVPIPAADRGKIANCLLDLLPRNPVAEVSPLGLRIALPFESTGAVIYWISFALAMLIWVFVLARV